MRGVIVDHMNAGVAAELALQIARKRRIDLEQQQLAVRSHPPRDLARMDSFAGTIFRNHTRAVEVNFLRDAFDQCL